MRANGRFCQYLKQADENETVEDGDDRQQNEKGLPRVQEGESWTENAIH
jgi:hypothetical protein